MEGQRQTPEENVDRRTHDGAATAGSLLDPGLDGDRVLRWPVVSADGDRIGAVGELRDRFFKVVAAAGPDFWLRTNAVASTVGGRITLALTRDALNEAKIDEDALNRPERDDRQRIGREEHDPADLAQIRPGWPVYTPDGERVGEVEVVRDGSIKVAPIQGRDYWLESDAVASTAGDAMTLRAADDGLERDRGARRAGEQ